MKKKLLALLCILTLISCAKNEELIYYTYEDVTITRLNKENEIYLYYGNFKSEESLPNSFIKCYSFDGFIRGFLVFKEFGNVELIQAAGAFEEINNHNSKFKINKSDSNFDYNKWYNEVVGNYKNIILFEDLQSLEIKANDENNSEVLSSWRKK